MRKVIWTVVAVLLILLLLVPVGGLLYLRTSLPKTKGTVQIDGLDAAVEIVRDDAGVPHIFATTDHDAFFALGYVHAQDRMWQLELNRRTGAGRLSEVLGEPALRTDKFLRTLGVYRAAEMAWPQLQPRTRALIEAYGAGINAWIDEGHTLPPEFLILGVTPEPWTPIDSLVWAKMMSWDLGGDWDLELLRAELTQAIGPERTAQIMPAYPENGTSILDASEFGPGSSGDLLDLDTQLRGSLRLGGLDVGSNNWVIAGSRTGTGLPMLANDPHLGARIPSIWYLAEIHGDTIHATGATLPGLPGFPTGHNGRTAWGVTNVDPDVQDMYVERINPTNPNQYEVNGEWVDMEIVEELIYVKGEEQPIRWAARSTRHGPLISDVSSTARPMAMRWTALDPDDTTVDAFLDVNFATNWTEFVDAFRRYVGPSQNFVYADVEGNIGYFAPGRIPIRANHDGMLPVPGWTDEYAWIGEIPFDELPRAFNPAKGYMSSANQRVVGDDYPYLISNDYTPPYRGDRINELIEEFSGDGRTISLDDMAAIQGDRTSIQARELLPLLLDATADVAPDRPALAGVDRARTGAALDRVRAWDDTAAMDSTATTIYEAWLFHLGQAMFADDLRGGLYQEMAERNHDTFLANIYADPAVNGFWCDDVLTVPVESCGDIALLALDAALDDITARLGTNMDRWAWSKIHITQYPHTPFSQVPALKPFFARSIANGGDDYTVNVAPVDGSDPYNQTHVPSFRSLIDLSDFNGSRFMHTTGQSGNVLSRHYDDLIEPHRDVEYLPMTWGRENVAGGVLRLEPR